MSKIRTSLQYERLLKNITSYGTDHRQEQRKRVLDEVEEVGSITVKQASVLLGFRNDASASKLLSELFEEGALARISRGVYGPAKSTKEGQQCR